MSPYSFQLSKKLSFTLRHGAIKQGIPIRPDGYVLVSDLLSHVIYKNKFTFQDIETVVKSNDKQRFKLQEIDGELCIRANQGHSMDGIEIDLIHIKDVHEIPTVVHGTFKKYLDDILKQGLSRMTRKHIHFAPGLPNHDGVISGMRKNSEVLIFIDTDKAMSDGIQFYKSENNVILSSGNDKGFIEPKYFKDVKVFSS